MSYDTAWSITARLLTCDAWPSSKRTPWYFLFLKCSSYVQKMSEVIYPECDIEIERKLLNTKNTYAQNDKYKWINETNSSETVSPFQFHPGTKQQVILNFNQHFSFDLRINFEIIKCMTLMSKLFIYESRQSRISKFHTSSHKVYTSVA
jgi:hypothetical protein